MSLSDSKNFQSVDCRVHDRKVERKEGGGNAKLRNSYFSLKAMESYWKVLIISSSPCVQGCVSSTNTPLHPLLMWLCPHQQWVWQLPNLITALAFPDHTWHRLLQDEVPRKQRDECARVSLGNEHSWNPQLWWEERKQDLVQVGQLCIHD